MTTESTENTEIENRIGMLIFDGGGLQIRLNVTWNGRNALRHNITRYTLLFTQYYFETRLGFLAMKSFQSFAPPPAGTGEVSCRKWQ